MFISVKGVTDDSRQVKPGYLFVALKGIKSDGHNYIEEAAKKGALAVVSDEIEESPFLPVLAVKNARKTLALLLNWFYNYPSRKMKVVGVTGTNGKTTTTYMIDKVFQEYGYRTGLIGTVIVKIDQEIRKANLTTPDAKELQQTFAQMVDRGVEYVTMEVSSQGLAVHRVEGVEFSSGIVTNLTLDHLDCHPNFEHYLESKKKFYKMLGEGKAIFLNVDDQQVMSLAKCTNSKVFTYGLGDQGDFLAKDIKLEFDGASFLLVVEKDLTNIYGERIRPLSFPIELQVLGKHNVYNALSAAALALYYGVSPICIQRALGQFVPVERRMETVYNREIIILDDTALNPASIDVVFKVVEKMKYRKLVVVNAIRGNRGIEVNRENAKTLAQWLRRLAVESLISTSSMDRVGEMDLVTKEEEEAFCSEILKEPLALYHYANLEPAIKFAVESLQPGDLLLLLGAQGMDDGARLAIECWREKAVLSQEMVGT